MKIPVGHAMTHVGEDLNKNKQTKIYSRQPQKEKRL